MDRRRFMKMGAAGLASLALDRLGPPSFGGSALAAGASGAPWKFGVMADTQWRRNLDGKNPGTVAVGIIDALNAEFVRHGVRLVIQVGDLVDVEYDAPNGDASRRTMPFRAAAAERLYEAGIGFFPLRGNHEASATAANELVSLYPQSRGVGDRVFGADDFSSPFAALEGLSYSFDLGNVRFVLLDQFTRRDGTNHLGSADHNLLDQQPWIEARLATKPSDAHAFVFGHKNLIGQNHTDCLFGATPASNLPAREAFIRALDGNGVRYYVGGHDHLHHRSIVTSPEGAASVGQLICSSNSYKFYGPTRPSRDEAFNLPTRERNVAQELFTIGYYIFTVDGPRVTVDFYSSSHGLDYGDVDLVKTPAIRAFFKRETFGYSLNGKQFAVSQGGSYAQVEDSFAGTTARILGGLNTGSEIDGSRRALVKTVNTGWRARDGESAASHVLRLWGLAHGLSLWDATPTDPLPGEGRTDRTDAYALSMSYVPPPVSLGNGAFGIASRDARGRWVNAVDLNHGGTKRFVVGRWQPSYVLGTYGVDPNTRTAWAVLDHEGEFAVAWGIEAAPSR
jgi:hypothetical protein